jgi:hypothetical protein
MVKRNRKKSKYVGKFPINSRITIDYSKKKPSVKFGYPRKETAFGQVLGSAAGLIPTVFISLCLFGFFISLVDIITNDQRYLDDLPSLESFLFSLIDIGSFILAILLAMTLVYKFYTKTKIGQRWFPEINKKISDARYYVKIKEISENKQFELPLFKNIYMDYRATKQFSKYLKRVEIREHPFDELIEKRGKTKKKRQVLLWKATFYFKQIPKEGFLEIWWT